MKHGAKIPFGLVAFMALFAVVLMWDASGAADDPCLESGIYVSNHSTVHLWYRRAGGNCTFLNKNAIITVHPQEDVDFFSDLTCETKFCPETLKYKDYKAADTAENCRVKIRWGCSLTDM